MNNSLELFFSSWSLFQNSVLAGVIAGATLGMLGIYVVIRRMVFLSAALSQVSGFGVVLAFYLQVLFGGSIIASVLSPTLGALIVSLVMIALISLGKSHDIKRRVDTELGFFFLAGSAGSLLLGTRIVQEIQDINSLLFGTAVAVLDSDFLLLVVVCAILICVHIIWHRAFTSISVDPIGGHVRQLPVKLINTVLYISLAVGISLVTRILGALPAFAFSVLPPLAAIWISKNIPIATLLATFIGAFCGFAGYLLAYLYDLPVGGTQVAVAIVVVCVSWLVRKICLRK